MENTQQRSNIASLYFGVSFISKEKNSGLLTSLGSPHYMFSVCVTVYPSSPSRPNFPTVMNIAVLLRTAGNVADVRACEAEASLLFRP